MRDAMWDDLAGIPHATDWRELRRAFAQAIRSTFRDWIAPDQPHFRDQMTFALGRFDEGAALVHFLTRRASGARHTNPHDVLDLGAGNGGVAAALANCSNYRVHTLDIVPNRNLLRLERNLRLPIRPIVGMGESAPFAPDTFDIVLVIDALEHIADPGQLASQVMRILRPGGVCMITTPPRLRYLLARDPHYGIRGLLLFPNEVQRAIVNRVFRRRIRTAGGGEVGAYDVRQTFWHVNEIANLFPGPKRVEVLYDRDLVSGRRFSRPWWRIRLRDWLWEHILIHKQPQA